MEAARLVQASHADAIRILMLTGARKTEILALKWSEVSMDRRLILLPSRRSKNGDIRTIYLAKPAISILEKQPSRGKAAFVFPCEASVTGRIVGVPETWKRVRKKAGLTDARLHDLRHNLATTAVGMNISLKITGALLGHKSQQSTEIYAHVATDPAQEASEQVAAKLWASRQPLEASHVEP